MKTKTAQGPQINIGTSQGASLMIDLDILIRTRLLVQANSGGGKSFLLRRLIEQAYGKVQIIVIDYAGEFSSLREKYDFVLAGKDGDTPADVRSAGLLATRLLELGASAVCDLYSLKPADRHIWVKNFFEAVMNSDKKLWHPVLFIVDEAHKFMPEKGEGESVAKPALLSLCSDGRKYGFCAVLATQRLAKLDKSGASELLNVLIGPTFIDLDLERAHKALGLVRSDWKDFDEQMKTVDPGHFWALGRAITKHRLLVKIGDVHTTHPEPGTSNYVAPPAPAKIKSLLPKLADLPAEADQKLKTEADLRAEINRLKAELSKAPADTVQPNPEPIEIKVPVFTDEAYKGILDAWEKASEQSGKIDVQLLEFTENIKLNLETVIGYLSIPKNEIEKIRDSLTKSNFIAQLPRPKFPNPDPSVRNPLPVRYAPATPKQTKPTQEPADESLTGPEQKILDAMAWLASIGQTEPTKKAVATLAGYVPGTGGFTGPSATLRRKGYIDYQSGTRMFLTDSGHEVANHPTEALTQQAIQSQVMTILDGPQKRILKPLLERWPDSVDKNELAELAGYVPGTGGFTGPIGRLHTTGIVDYTGKNQAKAADFLFLQA